MDIALIAFTGKGFKEAQNHLQRWPWYADETYSKVKGKWTYLYRAVNANGDTLDFMLSQHRSKKSALKFFRKNLHQNGSPHTINIDKSKANTAALVTLTQPY